MFKPNELPPITAGQYHMAINDVWQEPGKDDVLRWKLEIISEGIFKGRTLDKWSYLTKGAYYFAQGSSRVGCRHRVFEAREGFWEIFWHNPSSSGSWQEG